MINQLRADLFVLRHSGAAALCLVFCVVAAALYVKCREIQQHLR